MALIEVGDKVIVRDVSNENMIAFEGTVTELGTKPEESLKYFECEHETSHIVFTVERIRT